jgi:hypothetical protein
MVRYVLFLVLALVAVDPLLAGHGRRGGGCNADYQGDSFGSCGGGQMSYGGYGSQMSFGTMDCGQLYAASQLTNNCGAAQNTNTPTYAPPQTTPQIVPYGIPTQMPAPIVEPSAPAPQRSTKKYRADFREPIVSVEFIWVQLADGRLTPAPVINGLLPERTIDKDGELFVYKVKIAYSDAYKALNKSQGYLTYTDSTAVKAIHVAKQNQAPAMLAQQP